MKNKGVFAHGNVWALIMCTACLFCVWNKCSCTALYFHATEHGENDYHPREKLFLGCVYYGKLCLWDQVAEMNSGNWVATVFDVFFIYKDLSFFLVICDAMRNALLFKCLGFEIGLGWSMLLLFIADDLIDITIMSRYGDISGLLLGLWWWQIFTTVVVIGQLLPVARFCVYIYIYIYILLVVDRYQR